jgi:hypothetical protein
MLGDFLARPRIPTGWGLRHAEALAQGRDVVVPEHLVWSNDGFVDQLPQT